ncbi:MAG: MaoC family dehydratase N-terminal domain-containing protein [Caldilineales bacterium]|nr:MaoC family dehydratase N-terminal domain-containing protein [Caldilineales bacterium]MDW8318138.1 MaoC family dehydratase N-terminal domain-containing protein [Anaerolineae bacterium]
MLDHSYIGKKLPTIRYQVDASKIRELALALGDDNPIFHDKAAAQAAGYPDIVAPLTFPTLFRFWGGTAAGAETRGILQQMGANVLRILHGEEEYEYFGLLHPGDQITGELEILSIERKEGSAGPMDMVKTRATYRKQTGEVVVIARATMVVRW